MPGAHGTAWRYMFDWAVAGQALNCVPGDRVLEFGSGPSYASEFFNRLGYRTVALDLEPEILSFGHARLLLDQRLEPGDSHYVAGDGLRLPFGDAAFDGVES
jgi:SAM-dependent methyltransferase